MKTILQLIILLAFFPCLAQPTGHQKIFLEITDNGDTLHFERNFNKNTFRSKPMLSYKKYELLDISTNKTGFVLSPSDEFIHKTLMTKDHHIQIVRNRIDTMSIEILNAFNVYFLSISFQKGKYRMIVNDGKGKQWNLNTLPYKEMETYSNVYNITPKEWADFEVKKLKTNYSIAEIFLKQNLLAKPVLPEDDPNFRNPRRISTLRLEAEDYNFDGKKDYREHKFNNPKEWNYFIYKDSITGYVLDTIMSKLNITEFNFDKKTFNVKKNSKSNKELAQIDTYEFIEGKATLIQNIPTINSSLIVSQNREEEKLTSTKIYQVKPFKFELERNTPGINIPAEKEYYANKISVFEITNNQLIFETVTVGNSLKESPGCSDSLQIADFNFDGFPDFRICNKSVAGKHTYYVYHPKRKTFIVEHTLTELNGLTFDFSQKTAKGSTEKKKFSGHPWNSPYQFYSEMLEFEGIALENLTVTTTIYGGAIYGATKCKYINQKRIYEGDTLALKMQKKNFLSKEVGPFKFQVEFNPEELKTSGEKGAYVKRIEIYQGKKLVGGSYEMQGNYLKEVPHWLDSLEIADYNFDGFPDLRMYNSNMANGSYAYFLFNPDKEVQQFYADGLFSSAIETEYIPNRKILKGKIVESNLTRYLFLKKDTLTITIQDNDLTKPPFIEESIYKNGNRRGIRSAYGKLEPQLKKEFGDYNFDGFEDFRQQSKKNPSGWDVFIFNPKKETFIKDTLMSKFISFNYNKLDKSLTGYYTIKDDETTRTTYYYQWSFAANKMVLYQQQVCFSKFPSGESNKCIVSKLVNGKWVEIEQFGAE